VIVMVIGMFAVVGVAAAGAAGPGGPVGPPGPGGGAAIGGATAGMIVLGLLAIVGTLAALALKITGHVFCLPSPDAYGSRGLAVATLALVLTNLGCTLLNWVITLVALGSAAFHQMANPMAVGGTPSTAANVVNWIGILAGLGAFFVFLFYLRSLALATGYEGLARNIITFLITSLVGPIVLVLVSCIGCFAAGATMGAAMAKQNPNAPPNAAGPVAAMGAIGMICGGVWVIYFIAMFVWWVILLFQTRTAVGSRLRD
jgi:hypothetical protein